MGRHIIGHLDSDCFVRREVAGLIVLAAEAVGDRLSHQPYPTRKREEVTNRVKHSDNVPWVANDPRRNREATAVLRAPMRDGARVGRNG
jgi:hypothetical protein